jgi:hypothetical protein
MPFTRNTDPETSHRAADSVRNITETQAHILKVLSRPRTDPELIEAYRSLKTAPRASESGIRSRRSELVARGLVIDTGQRVKLPSGRHAVLWSKA